MQTPTMKAIGDRVPLHPRIGRAVGNCTAGVLLSYLLSRPMMEDGRIHAGTPDNIYTAIGMDETELKSARRRLRRLRLVAVDDTASPPVLYRLNADRLSELLDGVGP